MKGIIKKIIAITLLLQIVISGLFVTPSSYATEIQLNNGDVPTQAVGDPTAVPTTTPTETEADPFSKILDGLAGILLLPIKVIPLIVGKVLTWLMNAVVGEGLIGTLSVEDILFNNVKLTGVNFFEMNSGDSTVDQIRKSVSIWYYSIRNLAAILLIVIIVYVGIRMALSTIAEDKAKYKQMLIDWITGLALLFVLHYLMVAIVNINNILVDVLSASRRINANTNILGFININGTVDSALDSLFRSALSTGFTQGLGSALCYALLVGVTFLFLISYVKRMITIAFLIVIAPLVTVTYSIDKMGDSKSQALNTWLKEFSYNILIQPFQCVTYLALGQTSIAVLNNGFSLKAVIIAIAMLIFVLTSEKIIKHIFHFDSKSMSDTLAAAVGGATLISLASKAKSGGGGGKGGSGGGSSNNKFSNPQQSMTTPAKGAKNVRQGGNPNRPTSGPASSGSSGGSGNGAGSSGSSTGGTSRSGAGATSGSTSRPKSGGALGAIGSAAGTWMNTGLKIGGTLTGAMLGLGATGSVDKGTIQGGTLAGGFVSKKVQKSETNKKRRNLAKAYNNYANTLATQNPNLTADQINTQVRQKAADMLTGNVQGPLSDDEKALQSALKDMSSTYEKHGMSEEERNEALNKDFNGIETGAISETSAPMRFTGSVKRTASRVANRARRWGFNGQGANGQNPGGQQGQGQNGQGPQQRPRPQTRTRGQNPNPNPNPGNGQTPRGGTQTPPGGNP